LLQPLDEGRGKVDDDMLQKMAGLAAEADADRDELAQDTPF